MSKAILLSIKPEWLVKILNGEKTIEVRKLFPKNYVGWVYLYCSKNYKLNAVKSTWTNSYSCFDKKVAYADSILLNGEVVARFWCDKVEEIKTHAITTTNTYGVKKVELTNDTQTLNKSQLLKLSCLNSTQLNNYLDTIWWNGKSHICGYAINITNLEIFDKPRELGEFYKGFKRKYYKNHFAQDVHKEKDALVQPIKCGYEYTYPLTKAPQNYCYVEGEQL